MVGRNSLVVLMVLLALLAGACKGDPPMPTSVALDTPLLASPTIAPTVQPTPPAATPALLSEPLPTILVPLGDLPAIDGTIASDEWADARIETLADGSEMFLIYSDGYLYLAIRSATPEMIVGNIFVERAGEVAILHASAALGTARYAREGDIWQQMQAFVWRCRRTDDSEAAQEERNIFLEEEGWAATNSRIGTPNELEYQIEVTNETLHLAANILRSSDPSAKIPWPADLDDDCIKPTPGGLPEQLQFSLDQWGMIELPDSEA